MQGTATGMMLVCAVAIFKSHLHHTLNDCSSTRIPLLPDFSTSVYSVDGSAHQPPFGGLVHKPCERTIVLTPHTLLQLHQRVHVQGTVNGAATRTQTGLTKVRHLERAMKPSTKKKKCWHTERCRTVEKAMQPNGLVQNYPFSKPSMQQSLRGGILRITVQKEEKEQGNTRLPQPGQ